jgi:hypothetical protein
MPQGSEVSRLGSSHNKSKELKQNQIDQQSIIEAKLRPKSGRKR